MSEILDRQAEPGWLLPYMLYFDDAEFTLPAELNVVGKPRNKHGETYEYQGHGRWSYWCDVLWNCKVPDTPIPQVHFTTAPHRVDEDAIINVLKPYVYKGLGWYDDAWLALVKWILYGFGNRQEGIEYFVKQQLTDEIKEHWYKAFNIVNLLHSPIDWSAYILQGNLRVDNSNGNHKWSKTTGFFATPIEVCKLMTEMSFAKTDEAVNKVVTVCDPACGTGSQLLIASNYSLRLFGQDIVWDLTLCCELNGWLFAPWLVKFPDELTEVFEIEKNKLLGTAVSPEINLQKQFSQLTLKF